MSKATDPASETGPTPLLIAGPTASGKSAVALHLAERFDGVIINADSMQVYDVLQVITARPDAAELARAPHRLYGHIAPDTAYSVGRWQSEALAEIAAAQAAGKRPIIIGGTGMYFTRLTTGLVEVPPVDEAVQAAQRDKLAQLGLPALYDELTTHDPDLAARLAPGDTQRILRGLEVVHGTAKPLSVWQAEKTAPPLSSYHGVVLMPERQWLYQRCNDRFQLMLQAGALAEVEALLALKVPDTRPVMKAHGVPEMRAYLEGALSLEAATARAQQVTRRYAKRQMTWYRNQMADWRTLSEQEYIENIDKTFSFISK